MWILVVSAVMGLLDVGPSADIERLLSRIERLGQLQFPSKRQELEEERLLQEAQGLAPDDPRVLFWTAQRIARLVTGPAEIEEASSLWQRAIESKNTTGGTGNEVRARACVRLGYLHLAAGRLDSAGQWARRAIELAPERALGHELLVDLAYRAGGIAEVVDRLREAVHQPGQDAPGLWELYLELLGDCGDWDALRLELDKISGKDSLVPTREHFRAVLAEIDGQPIEAFCRHFIAMKDGEGRRRSTERSAAAVHRVLDRDDKELSGRLRTLVLAYWRCERPDQAEDALEELERFAPATAEEELVVAHLRVMASTTLRRLDDAERLCRRMLEIRPGYVPALCGLAELLEAKGDSAQADRWFQTALQLRPGNRLVRESIRMGARFRLSGAGVVAGQVDSDTPWHDFGLRPGDEVLQLDRADRLGSLAPLDRLRRARRFQGGWVVYRTPAGQTISREMELVLFDD